MAKTCSKGHVLERCVKGPDMINYCDGCHKRAIRAPEHVFRCEQCNFDFCQQCYVPEEYVKGEQVMIFSKGQQEWLHGNIVEVFRSECVYEGQNIIAGSLLVAHSSRQKIKFVPPENIKTCVRKAGAITQESAVAAEANTQPYATALERPPWPKDEGGTTQATTEASHQPCATVLDSQPVSKDVGSGTEKPALARSGTIWHHSPPAPEDLAANSQASATALDSPPVSKDVGSGTQDPAAAPSGTIWHTPQNQ